jgi:hypothetical protein
MKWNGIDILDEFLSVEDCDTLKAWLGKPAPGLRCVPLCAMDFVVERLEKATGSTWYAHGPSVSFQDTTMGMHEHRDGSYMGGTFTLLMYMSTPLSGGTTRFTECDPPVQVVPILGRAVLFDIDELHVADVAQGCKLVFALEVSPVEPLSRYLRAYG